ncbi:lactonase family protein [Mesobacillus maritimus]|uniref:lactonase family protein n=1 Tax=Mesobacillus maritimus TaxID=1643336 RepID=UPI00204150E1|nr:lactonase family protein [Mesobacillus maritimus]MCM3670195.1 lactonase family protein [Mesobacillus maritimus]
MNNKNKFLGFIGTYTKGESKGIYSFTLNPQTKTIENLDVAAELENPTYLAISTNEKFLYSVAKDGSSGGIASYSISENGILEFINHTLTEGAPPCHVSVGPDQSLLSTNYHKGTVDYYHLTDNGGVQAASSVKEHHGSGPDPRQEKAHTHYASFTPDGRYVVVVELGTDKIHTYRIVQNELIHQNTLSTKPGSGPRHLVFHHSEPIAYVMTEFSSEVIVLRYDNENGSFETLQTISTLPSDFADNNQGSAIHISSDGKFIYAGNRGHDSIAVFAVNQDTFQLEFIEHTSSYGNWPRDFILDPSEAFLIAANQNSNNLSLYARDHKTGKLTLLQKNINVPNPVCVKFLKNN